MPDPTFQRLGALKGVEAFRAYLRPQSIELPCDDALRTGAVVAAEPADPVEGLDDRQPDRHPPDGRLGRHARRPADRADDPPLAAVRGVGAKLIWGGEAVAVRHDGRANPNQLYDRSQLCGRPGARCAKRWSQEHVRATGSADGLVDRPAAHALRALQLPEREGPARAAHRLPPPDPRPARRRDSDAARAHRRRRPPARSTTTSPPPRWRRDAGIRLRRRQALPRLPRPRVPRRPHPRRAIRRVVREPHAVPARDRRRHPRASRRACGSACALSAFDIGPVPARPGPVVPGQARARHAGAVRRPAAVPLGLRRRTPNNPVEIDLAEPVRFLQLLRQLGIRLVNLTAGSPYYNPHIQRPAIYPPSDGYQPPEDPLVGVARQIGRRARAQGAVPGPGDRRHRLHVPAGVPAARRAGGGAAGLGRLASGSGAWCCRIRSCLLGRGARDAAADEEGLPHVQRLHDRAANGLPSGCYPLDEYYKGRRCTSG